MTTISKTPTPHISKKCPQNMLQNEGSRGIKEPLPFCERKGVAHIRTPSFMPYEPNRRFFLGDGGGLFSRETGNSASWRSYSRMEHFLVKKRGVWSANLPVSH